MLSICSLASGARCLATSPILMGAPPRRTEIFGGDGEFLVRVGTENRMQTLGHISLLGYSGSMIHPLCTGGPSESALGDPQEVTMAEWAQRCIDQVV